MRPVVRPDADPASPAPTGLPVGTVPVTRTVAADLPLHDVDPDVVAGLVLACPAVAGLSGGAFGSAATYLPGRRVTGIRLAADSVEVHPVLRYGATVTELARQVRGALAGLVGARTVDIVVEDVEVADEPTAVRSPVAPPGPVGPVVTGGGLGGPGGGSSPAPAGPDRLGLPADLPGTS